MPKQEIKNRIVAYKILIKRRKHCLAVVFVRFTPAGFVIGRMFGQVEMFWGRIHSCSTTT